MTREEAFALKDARDYLREQFMSERAERFGRLMSLLANQDWPGYRWVNGNDLKPHHPHPTEEAY